MPARITTNCRGPRGRLGSLLVAICLLVSSIGVVPPANAAATYSKMALGSDLNAVGSGWLVQAAGPPTRGEAGALARFALTGADAVPYRDLRIPLGTSLPPGRYRLFAKVLYGSPMASKMSLIAGSCEQTVSVPDKNAKWWTTGTTIETTSSISSATVRVYNTLETSGTATNQYYTVLGFYITSNLNELVMQDNRVVDLHYPTAGEIDSTPPVKHNYLENSSFELGASHGWGLNWPQQYPLASMVDTTTAAQGSSSIRLPMNEYAKILTSPVFRVRPNRSYTVSLYMKGTRNLSAEVQLRNAFTPDTGDGESYVATQTFAVTNQWQRFSFPVDLINYPAADYVLKVTPFGNGWPQGTYLWVDGVQVEEGSLSAYAPASPIEVGVQTSMPGDVFPVGQPVTADIVAYSDGAVASPVLVGYRVMDYFGSVTATGSVEMTVPAHAQARRTLSVPVTGTGAYTILASTVANAPSVAEAHIAVLPTPQSDLSEASRTVGAHVPFAEYPLSIAQRMGIQTDRSLSTACQAFRWQYVEPTKGQYVWDDTDVQCALAHNQTILGTLWCEPAWARDASGFPNVADYGDYVYNTALHYKGKVKYWEIWNEPNQRTPKDIPPDLYAQLLQVGAAAVRRADPNAKVVGMGGSSPAYIQSVMDILGSASCFDIFSTHLYPGSESDTGNFLRILARYGKPGWNSETGIKSAPDERLVPHDAADTPYARPGTDRSCQLTTEVLINNFAETMGTRVDGAAMSRYFYYDMRMGSSPDFPNTFSLFEYDGTLRAKGVAYSVLASFLDGAQGQGAVALGTAAKFYTFARGSQLTAIARCQGTGGISVTLPVASARLQAFNVMGNPVPVVGDASHATFKLGASSIYLRPNGISLATFQSALAAATAAANADTSAPTLQIDRPVAGSYVWGPLDVRVSSTDDVGVARVEFFVDGAANSTDTVYPYSTALDTKSLGAGTHTVTVRATDTSGNTCTRLATFSVIDQDGPGAAALPDTIAPVTSVSGIPAGWTRSGVTVSLSATDSGGCGGSDIFYRAGQGPLRVYAGEFSVSAEGTTPLDFWAVDRAGNVEPTKTADVRVDGTCPTLTVASSLATEGAIVFDATANDALSGISRLDSRVDSGAWAPMPRVQISDPGTHTVDFLAVDAAGNKTLKSATIAKSADDSISLAGSAGTISYGGTVVISGRLTTAWGSVSGAMVSMQALVGGTWQPVASGDATTSAEGAFAWSVAPARSTSYRAVFGGDSHLNATASPVFQLHVVPAVGRPRIPSRVGSLRWFRVSGVVAPASAGYARIEVFRLVRGKWRRSPTLSARTSTHGTYARRVRLRRGTWRMRTTYQEPGGLRGVSAFASMKVR